MSNIISSFGIIACANVDFAMSTSGYLEYKSITTNKYSPHGSNPLKSILTV